MDAGVAFSIAFLVGLFDLRGQPNLSEDTLEVVEAAVAETAASAERAVAATVGSTTVHMAAVAMDACVAFAIAFSVGFFDQLGRPKPTDSSTIESPPA